MKKTLVSTAVALLGVAALGAMSPGGAVATPNDKVTICHATASETNPYTVNTVDESSIDEQNNQYLNGHGDHEGDIIPPFRTFPGQNWTTEGQAIWRNGCKAPVPPPLTEVVVVPPTMTAPDCDAPGEVVVPEVTGLVYSTHTVGNGSVKVTVTADEGYVLAAGSDTSWTFAAADLAQWAVDDPRCVESLPPVVTPPVVTPPVVTPPVVTPPVVTPPVVVLPTEVGSVGPVPPVVTPPEAAPPAAVTPAATTPTALPATGGLVWPIFLIGLTALAAGIGAVRLASRPM